MSNVDQSVMREFVSTVRGLAATKKSATRYHIGTVTHTDVDGVVWVSVPGGSSTMPVTRASAGFKTGDAVCFTVENGVASMYGNVTDPAVIGTLSAEWGLDAEKIHGLSGDVIHMTAGYFKDLYAENVTTENLIATNGYIQDLVSKNITTENLQATNGYIQDLVSKNITTENIRAVNGYIQDLQSENVTAENLVATNGYIQDLTSKNITAEDIRADHAEIDSLDAHYAEIDLANVNNAWIERGVIRDAAIADAQILGVSANKLTAGEIDASEINVSNLRADNLIVRRMNGQPVVGGYQLVSNKSQGYYGKNPKEEGWYELSNGNFQLTQDTTVARHKPYYIEGDEVAFYDQDYIDSLKNELNQRIDGTIETFTGAAVPTTQTWPYTDWVDDSVSPPVDTRAEHVGDLYYVVNAGGQADGYCYRFAFDKTKADQGEFPWEWVLIRDSDVTAALQDIIDMQGDISGIKAFDVQVTSWQSNTDEEMRSVKQRTTNLETSTTSLSTYVHNDVKQAIDENSATITSMSETVQHGGKNLLLGSADYDGWHPSAGATVSGDTATLNGTSTGWTANISSALLSPELLDGSTFTLSFDWKSTADCVLWVNMTGSSYTPDTTPNPGSRTKYVMWALPTIPSTGGEWQRVSIEPKAFSIESLTSGSGDVNGIFVQIYARTDTTVHVRHLKLERGSIATPWDYASEDVTTLTNTMNSVKQTATENSAAITGLTQTVSDNKTSIENRASTIEQTLDGFSSTVSATIAESVQGENVLTGNALNPNNWTVNAPTAANFTKAAYGTAGTEVTFDAVSGYENLYSPNIPVTNGSTYTLSVEYTVGKDYNVTANHSGYGLGVYKGTGYPSSTYDESNSKFIAKAAFFRTQTRVAQTATVTFTATSDKLVLMLNGGHIADGQTGLSFTIDKLKLVESVSSRVSQAETAIEQTSEAIGLSASGTTTIANPNLSPFFTMAPDDRYVAGTNADGYWVNNLSTYCTELSDGWVHLERANTGSSTEWLTIYECAAWRHRAGDLKGSTEYTVMFEFRNVEKSGAVTCLGTSQHATSVPSMFTGNSDKGNVAVEDGVQYHVGTTVADPASVTGSTCTTRSLITIPAGASISCDMRVSLYEGVYKGSYKPYSGKALYASQAELKVANDNISSKVSTTDYTGATVASLINQSASTVKIQAQHVEIDGTTTFGSGSTATTLSSYLGSNYVGEKEITSATDFNTLTASGVYYIKNGSCANAPTTNWGKLDVSASGKVVQLFYPDALSYYYYRAQTSGTWSAWTKVDGVGAAADVQANLDKLGVSGRNLLVGTYSPRTSGAITLNSSNYWVWDAFELYTPYNKIVESGDLITVSFDWSCTATGGNWHLECGTGSPYTWGTVVKATGTRNATSHYVDVSSSNKSGHVEVTFQAAAAHVSAADTLRWLRIRVDGTDWSGKTFHIANAKAERGNRASEWTYAPEDSVEIGRNLAMHPDIPEQWTRYAPTAYTIAQIPLSEDFKTGYTYTVTVWGGPITRSDKSECWYSCYWGGGNFKLGDAKLASTGVYRCTFTVSTTDTSQHTAVPQSLVLYNTPAVGASGTTYSAPITRVKVERSAQATDFSYTPESVVVRTQRIYYRTQSSAAPSAPTAWVTESNAKRAANNATPSNWTTKVTSIAADLEEDTAKYLYLWTCVQSQNAAGGVTNSAVLLDDSTTVIDGGKIITGSVTANQIDATYLHVSAANVDGTLTFGQVDGLETALAGKQAAGSYATTTALTTETNQRKAQYGTCTTAAGTAEKAVTCANFELVAGNELTVKFSAANTTSAAVTLNVNAKGAKAVWVGNAVTSATNQLLWGANAYITFRYDGTQFQVIGEPRTWYGACTTAEGTAAKTDTTAVTGCVVCKGAKVELAMTNANTATSPTLNIQSTGAKAVYFGNGTARPTKSGGTSWLAANTCTFTFDGAAWRTQGKTFIDANSIVTGKVGADHIDVASISIGNLNGASTVIANASNGNTALTKVNHYTKSVNVGNSSNTQTAYWRKFATATITGIYIDYTIQFTVQSSGTMSNLKKDGVLRAHVRTNGTAGTTTQANDTLEWISRAEGISLTDWRMGVKATSGTNVVVDLWAYCPTNYIGYQLFVDFEATRTNKGQDDLWTMVENWSENGVAYPSDYTFSVVSTDTDAARQTATNYIAADSSGIRIASANPGTQNQHLQLTSSHATFYDSGGTQRVDINSSSGVIVGKPTAGRAVLTDAGAYFYDTNNKKRSQVDASGLNVYDTDGSTSVAQFAATARIGKSSSYHANVTSSAFTLENGTTEYSRMDLTKSVLNQGAFQIRSSYSSTFDDDYEYEHITGTIYGASSVYEYRHNSSAKGPTIKFEYDVYTGDQLITLASSGGVKLTGTAGLVVGGNIRDGSHWLSSIGSWTNVSGSNTSVANSSWVVLASIKPAKGRYLMNLGCFAASNSTGRRIFSFGASSGSSRLATFSAHATDNNIYITYPYVMDADGSTTYHVYGWQNSGSALEMSCYIRAVCLQDPV